MERISELMTADLCSVHEDSSIEICARVMLAERVRHLPVVDADGRLLGVVNDFEVFAHGIFTGDQVWTPLTSGGPYTAAQLAMPVDVVRAADDLLLPAIVDHVRSPQDVIVVVDGGMPVGIITEHDGVRLAGLMLPFNLEVGHAHTWPVHMVQRDAPAHKALAFMRANRIRHIPVVDGKKAWGVVSYRDLVRGSVGKTTMVAAERFVVHTQLHTIAEGSGIREAAAVMVHHKIGCLPVQDERGQVTGIISRLDILNALIHELEAGDLFSDNDDGSEPAS